MRKISPYTLVAVGIALLYLGWVAATRYLANREMGRAGKAAPARAYKGPEEPAGTAVKLLQFYASSGEVTKGQHVIVCYGVENARSVQIDPPIQELKPARNRCFSVTPERSTTFKLVVDGLDGTQLSASFTVKVNPAPPTILFLAVSHKEIRRGEPFTMCYGVANASAVQLEPIGWNLPPVEKNCVRSFPPQTTRFTLVASSADGRTDREKFTLKVR